METPDIRKARRKGMMTRRKLLQTSGPALVGAITLPALSEAIQTSSRTYQRPKLKITDVRTAMVLVHGPQAHIRIYTDQGLVGQGESTDAAIGTPALVHGFRDALIGKDPLNVEAIWEEIRRDVFSGPQGGQYMTALSGLEIALWDLAGKALGMPVYQLLGGKFRDKVRIYLDTDMEDNMGPEAERKVAFAKENGFSVAKIDIDAEQDPNRFDRFNRTANNAELDRMLREVQHVREKLDAKIELAVDMHAFYDAPTGKRVAKELEPFHLLWLEEPVPPENIEAMAEIKRSTNTPIACGENLYMRWGYAELMEKRAVDIIQPDFQKTGGLGEGKKIANLAETYYIPVAPHCVVSPVGLMASVHACATFPNFLALEWHWVNYPDLWKNWVKEGEIIEKGFVTVPDRPGLGVEMNDEVAKKAQMPGTSWFAPNAAESWGGS
jgi:galactonate dehydratase